MCKILRRAPSFKKPPSAFWQRAARRWLGVSRHIDHPRVRWLHALCMLGWLWVAPSLLAALIGVVLLLPVVEVCRRTRPRIERYTHGTDRPDLHGLRDMQFLLFACPSCVPVVAQWIAYAGSLQRRHTDYIMPFTRPSQGNHYLARCLAYNGSYDVLDCEEYLPHLVRGELLMQVQALQLQAATVACAPLARPSRL